VHLNNYIVLLADLVDSRSVESRVEFSHTLRRALDALLTDRNPNILAPMQVLKGIDELGMVASTPGCVIEQSFRLNMAVWPQSYRFGVSAGGIDIGWPGSDLSAMDGSAFHRASAAVLRSRADKLPYAFDNSIGGSPSAPLRELIESSLALYASVVGDWPKAASTIARKWFAHNGNATHAELAADAGIDRTTVTRALARCRVKLLHSIERRVIGILDQMPENE
jgi:hypothetical protein